MNTNITEELEPAKAVNAGHTPGPWTLETVKTSIGSCHKVGKFPCHGSHQFTAACVYVDGIFPGMSSPISDELLANARLIAAAPEMLAALRELIDCKALKDHIDAEDYSAASDEYIQYVQRKRKAWDAARQAHAKALGF